MSKVKRYFLAQDNDCHWFLVDADRRAEWEAWRELGPDEALGWRPPDCATELGRHPSSVTFENPTYEH